MNLMLLSPSLLSLLCSLHDRPMNPRDEVGGKGTLYSEGWLAYREEGKLPEKMAKLLSCWGLMPSSFMDHRWGMVGKQSERRPLTFASILNGASGWGMC